MICKYCSTEFNSRTRPHDREGRFTCPKCGHVYRVRTSAQNAPQTAPRKRNAPTKRSSSKKQNSISQYIIKILKRRLWKLPVWAWLVIVIVVLIAGNGKSPDSTTQTDTTAAESELTDTVEATESIVTEADTRVTFELSPTQYLDGFNAEMVYLQNGVTMVDNGGEFTEDGSTFIGSFTVDQYVSASYSAIGSNDYMFSVTFIGCGDGTVESGLDIMSMFSAAISSFGFMDYDDAMSLITSMESGDSYSGTDYFGLSYKITLTQSELIGSFLTITAV